MRNFLQILPFSSGLAVLHKLLQWQTEFGIFPSTLAYVIPVSSGEAKPVNQTGNEISKHVDSQYS